MLRLIADVLVAVWILGMLFTFLMLVFGLGHRNMNAVSWIALFSTAIGLAFFWPITVYIARNKYNEQNKRNGKVVEDRLP